MRKSFTLIEVLIAVSITVFIFMVVFNILFSLKKSKEAFLKKIGNKNDFFVKALYYDILNAKDINIVKTLNPDYDKVYLKTSNSLYGFYEPYVLWIVKKNTLFRIESQDVIELPGDYKYFDGFLKDVKIFKVYKKENKYFVFADNEKKIYFEFKGIK